MLDILRRQLYSANEQKQQNKLLCNYIFFFLYKPINFDLTEVKHVGWMHFTRRHAVFFSFLFCDPPLIPFSLHLPNSTRGSEVRLGYRTTPLEVSEAPRLAQRHLYTTDLISLYASAQPLLAILVINLPHTRTEESIIDTWYDPHKCCHIKDNYSYQYEPDCPCIDVIFPSALIRPFCVQNAPRGAKHNTLTCMNNKTILRRVAVHSSFPVWTKKDRPLCKIVQEAMRKHLQCKHVLLKNVAPTIYFTVSEWQRWLSTTDSDTRQRWILSWHHSKATEFLFSPSFFPLHLSTPSLRGKRKGTVCFLNSATLQRRIAFQHAAIFLIIHPNAALIRAPDQASIFLSKPSF